MSATINHAGGPARIVYLGSPEMAVEPLRALVEAGHEVVLVVTNPDRRRGRGKELSPTPVKAAAAELGIAVSHDVGDVLSVEADLGVVVAFGHLIGQDILDALPLVNLHFSLLPRWRGAAPVERAMLAGDETTGVCLMQIELELDAGGVYDSVEVPIGDLSINDLRNVLVTRGTDLLVRSLEHGFGEPEPQVGEPSYARKIQSSDLELDFELPASQVERVVRLERAFTTIDGRRLRIIEAAVVAEPVPPGTPAGRLDGIRVATAEGWLELITVQPEGRKAVSAPDWVRGARLDADVRLGT